MSVSKSVYYRRDVVYFGVDEYDDPLLTYYQCQEGNCSEIYDMKCNRTCDDVKFNFEDVNVALLQVSHLNSCLFRVLWKSKLSNLQIQEVVHDSRRAYDNLTRFFFNSC